MPQKRRILKQFLDRHIQARRQPMQCPRMRLPIAVQNPFERPMVQPTSLDQLSNRQSLASHQPPQIGRIFRFRTKREHVNYSTPIGRRLSSARMPLTEKFSVESGGALPPLHHDPRPVVADAWGAAMK